MNFSQNPELSSSREKILRLLRPLQWRSVCHLSAGDLITQREQEGFGNADRNGFALVTAYQDQSRVVLDLDDGALH